MAGIAVRREPRELSGCAALMARDAINRCMCSDQREAIFVSAYGLQRHVPADHTVALLAIRAKLPAVNVSVAV